MFYIFFQKYVVDFKQNDNSNNDNDGNDHNDMLY